MRPRRRVSEGGLRPSDRRQFGWNVISAGTGGCDQILLARFLNLQGRYLPQVIRGGGKTSPITAGDSVFERVFRVRRSVAFVGCVCLQLGNRSRQLFLRNAVLLDFVNLADQSFCSTRS